MENNIIKQIIAKYKQNRQNTNNSFEEALSSQKLSSNDRMTSSKLENAMNSGKTITLNQPKSQRFTFNQHIAEKASKLENFKPKTTEEKSSLSPYGYFRGKELLKERESFVARKEQAAADTLGKELTPDQKELVDKQAENVPVNEVEIPSTALKTVKYNPKTQELWVTFAGSNKKYWYPRVPQDKVQALMEAPSKGEYFIKNIHDVYTVNPGHSHEKNVWRNNKVAKNYYKKAQKYYRNVRTKGHM